MNEVTPGQRIRKRRETLGLSIVQVARKCGTSYQTISKIERDLVKSPGGLLTYKLAEVLKTTVPYLMNGIGFEEPVNEHGSQVPLLNIEETPTWCSSIGKTGLFKDKQQFLNIPTGFENKSIFAIKLNSDAMEGYIPKGSILYCKPDEEIKNGEIMVFFDETAKKTFVREAVIDDKTYLRPLNTKKYEIKEHTEGCKALARVISWYVERPQSL